MTDIVGGLFTVPDEAPALYAENIRLLHARNINLRAENIRLTAENERLRAVLKSVMIGGNSLAQIIGADHPPHGTPYGEALTHYGSGVKYEAWCCWNAIMLARAALEGT